MVGRGRPRGRGRPAKQRRDGRERPPSMPECFRLRCGEILDRIQKKDTYSIFLEPVDVSEAPEYDKIIKRPMDLSSIRKRLNADSYQSLSAFHDDLNLIWSNCLTYNGPEPSNIYSKKAIDLKKLTDRLIPSAKVGLDHDREVHDQWMERHRRKPHPSASPSSSALGLRFGVDPAYPPPNGLGPAATVASLPVTAGVAGGALLPVQAGNVVNVGSAVGVDPPYPSAGVGTFGPTTPRSDSADPAAAAHLLILARREALREQYGTTGLYRPQSVTASDDFVYLASDLPDFRPSSLRYNPHARIPDENRIHSGSSVVLKRRLDLPDVKYKILGIRRRLNPCRPIATVDSVRVKDYVQSLQAFVAGAGVIASKIISELLSPELAVQLAEEETKKRKRETASIVSGSSSPGSAARGAAALDDKALLSFDSGRPTKQGALGTPQSSRPMPTGQADSSPGETTLVARTPLLPKLSKSIPELDGEEGLEILVGADLANEVRTIPVHAIDFSMPYGVNTVDMNNIAQMASLWRSPDSSGDLSFLHQLKHETDRHSRRLADIAAAGSVPGQLGIVPSPDMQGSTFAAVKAQQQVALSSIFAQQSHGMPRASRASDRNFPVSKIPSIAPTLGNAPRSGTLELALAHQKSYISGEFNESTAVLTPGSPVVGTETTSHVLSSQQLQADVTPISARSCGMAHAVTAEYQHGQRNASRAHVPPSTPARSSFPINTVHESAQFHAGQRPQAHDLIVGARNPTNTVAKAAQQMAYKAANAISSEGRIPNAVTLPNTYPANLVNDPNELAGHENQSCENCGDYFTTGWRDVPDRVERICSCGQYPITNKRVRPTVPSSGHGGAPGVSKHQGEGSAPAQPHSSQFSTAHVNPLTGGQQSSTSGGVVGVGHQNQRVIPVAREQIGEEFRRSGRDSGLEQGLLCEDAQLQAHTHGESRSRMNSLTGQRQADGPQPLHSVLHSPHAAPLHTNLKLHDQLSKRAKPVQQQQSLQSGHQPISPTCKHGGLQLVPGKQARRSRPKKKAAAAADCAVPSAETQAFRPILTTVNDGLMAQGNPQVVGAAVETPFGSVSSQYHDNQATFQHSQPLPITHHDEPLFVSQEVQPANSVGQGLETQRLNLSHPLQTQEHVNLGRQEQRQHAQLLPEQTSHSEILRPHPPRKPRVDSRKKQRVRLQQQQPPKQRQQDERQQHSQQHSQQPQPQQISQQQQHQQQQLPKQRQQDECQQHSQQQSQQPQPQQISQQQQHQQQQKKRQQQKQQQQQQQKHHQEQNQQQKQQQQQQHQQQQQEVQPQEQLHQHLQQHQQHQLQQHQQHKQPHKQHQQHKQPHKQHQQQKGRQLQRPQEPQRLFQFKQQDTLQLQGQLERYSLQHPQSEQVQVQDQHQQMTIGSHGQRQRSVHGTRDTSAAADTVGCSPEGNVRQRDHGTLMSQHGNTHQSVAQGFHQDEPISGPSGTLAISMAPEDLESLQRHSHEAFQGGQPRHANQVPQVSDQVVQSLDALGGHAVPLFNETPLGGLLQTQEHAGTEQRRPQLAQHEDQTQGSLEQKQQPRQLENNEQLQQGDGQVGRLPANHHELERKRGAQISEVDRQFFRGRPKSDHLARNGLQESPHIQNSQRLLPSHPAQTTSQYAGARAKLEQLGPSPLKTSLGQTPRPDSMFSQTGCRSTQGEPHQNVPAQLPALPLDPPTSGGDPLTARRSSLSQADLSHLGHLLSSSSSGLHDVQESRMLSRRFGKELRDELPLAHSTREQLQHATNSQEAALRLKANFELQSNPSGDRGYVPVPASCGNDHLKRMNEVVPPESSGGSGFMNSIHDLMTSNDRGCMTQTVTDGTSPHCKGPAHIPGVSAALHRTLSVPVEDSLIGDMIQANASPAGHIDHETETEQHMVQSLFYGHGMGDRGPNADDDIVDTDFGF